MLGISTGLTDINLIRWDLAGCLLLAWIIVYCALWKGVTPIGKVRIKIITSFVIIFSLISVCLRDCAVPLRDPPDPAGQGRHAAGLHCRGRILHHAAVG